MINFNNKFYGNCSLFPIQQIETMHKIYLIEGLLDRASLGDKPDRTISMERINKIYEQNNKTYSAHNTCLYEIRSEHHVLLGIAGFFCETEEDGKYLELCWYIMPEHQKKGLATDSCDCLLSFAFLKLPDFFSDDISKSKSGLSLNKIIADAFPGNWSTNILVKYGFVPRDSIKQFKMHHLRQYGQVRYEISREKWGLRRLSKLLESEKFHMLPRLFSPGNLNMERARRLWFAYFDKGILLANGGIENSLITEKEIIKSDNIKTFNMYRSDRPESTVLDVNDIKRFLCDEHIFLESDWSSVIPVFTLGSHEGYTRLLRSLYKFHSNEEVLYPISGYGFLAVSAETILPTGYRLRMINNIKEEGEKIDIAVLAQLAKKHPLAKTLFLELKTIAGAIYNEQEIIEIIKICKKYKIFLIADAAHINMDLSPAGKYPNVFSLCIENEFHEFAVLYTGSKTYGLERGRVGFAVFSKNVTRINPTFYAKSLYRELGSVNDMPFELAKILIQTEKTKREDYLNKNNAKHRLNMNILLAYIYGIASEWIDNDLHDMVCLQIPEAYAHGIPGITAIYKPLCGIHLKIDISKLINKYYFNIQIFNSEIFCYLLNSIAGVVTLHGYQLMDPLGVHLRIGFSRVLDIHNGMQAIHNLTKQLTDHPVHNPFVSSEVIFNKTYFTHSIEEKLEVSKKTVDGKNLHSIYRHNIQSRIAFYKPLQTELDEKMNLAASTIQLAVKSKFNLTR